MKLSNMKLIVLCVFLFGSTWAFPKVGNNTWHKNPHGISDVGPRITGGKEATAHSIPYQAYIIIWENDEHGWSTGGSLITPRHILTSARRVVYGVEAEITLGAHNIVLPETGSIIVKSKNLIPHPDYDANTHNNDIAIIVLDEPVELNDYIQTVKLPSNASNDYIGETARVSGWGFTAGDANMSPVLLEAYTQVISNQECYETFDTIVDSQVCTQSGSGPEGHCNGDSGDPLTVDNVQIGVVSYGIKGCLPGYPSAYTRVSSYLTWIEENIS